MYGTLPIVCGYIKEWKNYNFGVSEAETGRFNSSGYIDPQTESSLLASQHGNGHPENEWFSWQQWRHVICD
jgi:hypothetical protein